MQIACLYFTISGAPAGRFKDWGAELCDSSTEAGRYTSKLTHLHGWQGGAGKFDPHHLDLSTGLLEHPREDVPSFPQTKWSKRTKQKQRCLLWPSLRSHTLSLPPFYSWEAHYDHPQSKTSWKYKNHHNIEIWLIYIFTFCPETFLNLFISSNSFSVDFLGFSYMDNHAISA